MAVVVEGGVGKMGEDGDFFIVEGEGGLGGDRRILERY